jgi:hypothetical protein
VETASVVDGDIEVVFVESDSLVLLAVFPCP